jgi:hypothetical protein
MNTLLRGTESAEAAKQPDRVLAPREAKRSVGNLRQKDLEPAKLAAEINSTGILLQTGFRGCVGAS